jgi:polar amino acid transport system substrate-binding protein
MKKLFSLLVLVVFMITLVGCGSGNTLVVYTEAGFAPFEYVKDGKITGVDIEIMEKVGEKLGKKVVFEDVAFDTIVDAVSEGKLTNVGAAGLSITPEREEKVAFSKVYYQANLYVIYKEDSAFAGTVMSDGNTGAYWSSLQTSKGIGIQTGTTADFFLSDEIVEGGSLEGVKKTEYDSLSVAVNDIGLNIDFVVIDELPAKMLVEGNEGLACLPLYYEGGEGEADELAYDQYAICVTKGQDEILAAINEVLTELLKEDANGVSGIEALVNKHLGIK